MDLLQKTKELCKSYNIRPKRSRGQNFLVTSDIYDKVVEVSGLEEGDTVLEVGPGLGFLTVKLALKVKRVIAVEFDDKLAGFLKKEIDSQGIKNVEVVNENILDFQIPNSKFQIPSYKIVANLPYNITSVFLRRFLEREDRPSLMVLMLQKEVAERIVAEPGDMSLLALSVQFYAKAGLMMQVLKNNFYPEPQVNSAVVKLIIKNEELRIKDIDEKKFFQLARIGFSAKRKMLKNNLGAGFKRQSSEIEKILEKIGLNPKARAEDLSLDDWAKCLKEMKGYLRNL